ncbi:hypothetical protein [Arthrobacter castelli]|uniref:hypothetical protein n=1 Tax=Arthrobacter castelli TaxID=271431 RepID=UPI00040B2456|nr:hypothetical protein [Arthrobacter castelli]
MSNIIEKIAESFKSFGASTVYGDPVTINGAEIVPVCYVQYGFGGGGTADDEGGGGGGGIAVPVGIYRTNDCGKPVFRPNTLALLVSLTPLVWTVGRAASRVLKESRR